MVAMATAVRAQIALEAGLNMSNMAIKAGDTKLTTGFKAGGVAGILADIHMGGQVYFQPGFFYQSAGCNITSTPAGDYTVTTVTVPINFVYKTGEKCGARWMFGFGPYIADNVSGTFSRDAYGPLPGGSGSLVFGSDPKDNLKGLDMGINAGVGYQTKKHFYFRLRYQLGLANLSPTSDGQSSIKTTAIGVSIGYLFGSCAERGYGFGSSGGSHWRGMSKSKYSRRTYNYHKKWL